MKDAEEQTPWPCDYEADLAKIPICSGFDGKNDAWSQVKCIKMISKMVGTDHIMTATVGTSTDRIRLPCTLTNRILSNKKKCKSLCGVSLGFFNQTMESLQGKFMKSRVLTDKDQLVLYFMKLKTRLSFIAISTIMNVHHATASKSFCHTLNAHFEVARKYLWYLTRDEVKATLPDSFKLHYPNTRVIIDASETKIQCPCAVNSSVLCYSHYKSNHTCKWLVGIAPCGLITFMSRAFGGRVTGKDNLYINLSFGLCTVCAVSISSYTPKFLQADSKLDAEHLHL
jgi:hypothetical protein